MSDGYVRFLDVAVAAAREAGEIIIHRLGSLSGSQIEMKAAADFVTEVDRASEDRIVTTIAGQFPTHAFLAEEEHAADDSHEYRWIIDPLDGTTNYIHQFPVFSVSIALQHRGVTVLGVVFDPVRDELFTGVWNGGARLDGKPISVSGTGAGGTGLVATGFPFRNRKYIDLYLDAFKRVFLSVGDLRRAGSAAIDLAYVAAGRVDGFFELGLAPWDMAAGALLIREAGGIVTDFGGGDTFLRTGNIVAGSGAVHQLLLQVARDVFGGTLDR